MARASGEGTVRKNVQKGRWEGRVTTDYDPETRKTKRSMVTGKTRGEVLEKMKELQRQADQGVSVDKMKMTVDRYLIDWLDNVLPGTVASATERHYRDNCRLWISPYIGKIELTKLRPSDVTKMMQALSTERGLSPNSVRIARSTLRRALRYAERDGIIGNNPAALADGVRMDQKEGRFMPPEMARELLDSLAGTREAALYTVALTLGLRRGELLGLAWEAIDLDNIRPTMQVVRQLKRGGDRAYLELGELKTSKGRRTIHLPAMTAQALRTHRAMMAAEKLALGADWKDQVLGFNLVFRTPLGTPMDPDNFGARTRKLTTDLFGEAWSPHTMRHSAASLLIAQGVDLKLISEVLGHSSIRMTADVYGHLMPDAGHVAADAMDELFS
jgi:integrase